MASIIDKDRFRGRETASQGSGGGDGVDGIVKRLENVESAVTEIRGDVREIKIQQTYLATKQELIATIGSLRVELTGQIASVREQLALLRADMNALETRIIKWMIGTVFTAAALSFSAAKFFS